MMVDPPTVMGQNLISVIHRCLREQRARFWALVKQCGSEEKQLRGTAETELHG